MFYCHEKDVEQQKVRGTRTHTQAQAQECGGGGGDGGGGAGWWWWCRASHQGAFILNGKE